MKRSWILIWLIWACGVAGAVQVGKVPPTLPHLIEDIQLGLTQAGWVASVLSLIGVFMGALAGRISDQYGARRNLILGLLIIALGSILGSFTQTFIDLLATRVLEGIGLMLLMVSAPPLMQRHAPEGHTGMAMGIWGAFMPFGVASILLLSPVMLEIGDWRSIWRLATAWALLMAMIAYRVLPKDPAPHARQALKHDLKKVLSRTSIPVASSCFGLYSAIYLAVLSFFPVWLIETRDLPLGVAASLTALYASSNMLGNLAAGHAIRKGTPAWFTIRLGAAVMATTALVMFVPALPLVAVLLASLLYSGFGGLIPASTFALVAQESPSAGLIGVSSGVILHFLNLGQLLGPPLLALTVASAGGWQFAPLMLSGLSVVSIALTFWLARLVARP